MPDLPRCFTLGSITLETIMTIHAPRLKLTIAALLAMTAPAFAQSNLSLENITSRNAQTKTNFAIERVDVTNTNLSRDELAKLFSGETPREEALAIAGRMKADRLAITGATATSEDGKMTFGPFEATGIDNGRFGKATLASFAGVFSDKEKHGGFINGRALTLEQGDIAPLIRAAQTKNADTGGLKVGRVSWDGFDGAFTDKETPADAPGGNQVKVSLRGLNAVTEFSGGAPVSSKGEAVGFTLDPAPASEFGKALRAFGYERIDLGLAGAGRYDPAAQRLVLENYAITSPNAGRLSVAGEMSGIDAGALSTGDATQRGLALLGSSVEGLRVNFVNEGLVEKAFAFAAAKQGKSPAALRSEMGAMAAQILPLLLGGDPQSLALAQSAQTFLKDPKNFTLTLKARGAPVPLARLGSIRDPATFLALVDVSLVANQ